MGSIKSWVSAFRLRTLPLSVSLILMGSALAYQRSLFSWSIFTLALSTTLLLQILSNLANDYGDAVSGADTNGKRIGPQRAVQSGTITKHQMMNAIVIFSSLSLISGLLLLFVAYPRIGTCGLIILLVIGILSIIAAITYTMGKHPYGYVGLGDLSCFIFFGLVGVSGCEALYEGGLWIPSLLPASSVGLLSVAVLNMNNMRDYESDKSSGKISMVVKIGLTRASVYQIVLIIVSFSALIAYIALFGRVMQYLSLLTIPIFAYNAFFVMSHSHKELDSQLPVVSLGTMLLVLLFVIGCLL